MHTFDNNGKDGSQPDGGLIFDAIGNIYGTTVFGGPYDSGIVFELEPAASGGWAERILHTFNANGTGKDGQYVFAGLISDPAGNLYGTTLQGGAYGYGTVFEMMPATDGSWTEKILYNFGGKGADGISPYARLILDDGGNLYGTTYSGGSSGFGTVFELTSDSAGWSEQLLHNFSISSTDGRQPLSGLIFDASGNLYGTTQKGGTDNSGTVFEVNP